MAALLTWDLRDDATRTALLSQTFAALGAEGERAVRDACERAGVPQGHCHDIAEMRYVIDGLDADEAVKEDMHSIYGILAEAEAAAHGVPLERAHFHEVGDGKAIGNALLICMAVRATDVDAVEATAVQCGSGFVECAHGRLAVPAPATQAIIDRGLPLYPQRRDGELLTPTSAAIILHFVDRWV